MRRRLMLATGLLFGLFGLMMGLIATAGLHYAAVSYTTEQVASAARRVAYLTERDRLTGPLITEQVPYLQVVDATGKIVASTRELEGEPRISNVRPSGPDGRVDQRVCVRGRCLILVALRIYKPGGNWVVYAADDDRRFFISPIYLASLTTVILSLVALGVGVTYRTVTRTLLPVDAIRTEMAEITSTDLGRRVPVPPQKDQVRALAITVNQTLDRLEELVEQQRRFASDASHDLRSPITAMRTQVEEALLYPHDVDWTETGNALLASLDRLQAIVSDLLMLARLDAGTPASKQRIDLAELVGAELDARARGVRVERRLEPGVTVTGDRIRLTRMLTNLVDNAERHAASLITVTVTVDDGRALLEVLDDGAGIAPDKWDEVFQRFTRLDASRSRDAGGTGLGLPIAREIAEAHGGTLRIEESAGGARFVLRLPLAR
jgi:signal transduction histidine kinase